MGDICAKIDDDFEDYVYYCETRGEEYVGKNSDTCFYEHWRQLKIKYKDPRFVKSRKDHLPNGRFTPQD